MIRNKIPAKSRSKYYRTNTAASNIIGGGSSVSGGGAATGSGSGIPYTVDIDGNYIVGQPTYFPAVGIGEDLISSERVITWDQAVTMAHEHANKEAIDVITLAKISNWDMAYTQSHWHTNKAYLDLINQDLSTGATVLHNIVRASDRLSVRGAYGDAVYWYAIYGNADKGIVVDASTEVRGDINVTGKGTMSSLTVTGAFNCYELVANKVRSTNGYLYVTDSTPILDVLYIGYNNKGEAEAKVKIESGRLREGDYVILQKFTGNQVVKMTFFCSWAETAENMFVVNKDGLTTEQLRVNLAMNDVLVRVDNANVSDRRTGILLSPYDGSYIDFYTGNGDGINNTIVTSIGNLDHLGKTGVSGYGFYTDNGFFTGDVNAKNLRVENKITGDMIDATTLRVQHFEATDDENNKILSINETGDGAQCWFVGGRLVSEIRVTAGEVRWIYYDENGSVKWYIGSSGTPVHETTDMYREFKLVKVTNLADIEKNISLAGSLYKEFRSGSVSGNQNYNGLTIFGTFPSNTPPSSVSDTGKIQNGTYTLEGLPDKAAGSEAAKIIPPTGYTLYERVIYTYQGGYRTSTSKHTFLIRDLIDM